MDCGVKCTGISNIDILIARVKDNGLRWDCSGENNRLHVNLLSQQKQPKKLKDFC